MKPAQYHYDKFPPKQLDWKELIPLIGPASAALARYDGTLSAIPNPAVFLSPLTTQEAVLSSRIEGTQATMGEVLEYEAQADVGELSAERKADINEVLNYRRAIRRATDLLNELPLCERVIRAAHEVLLQGVRGQDRSPGEYRRVPNWIGPKGCPIEKAKFIPISADKLPNGMREWEAYIHEKQVPDRLVQLAILHAEFEALHPFLDGNGRLGRMFVPLFLHKFGLVQSPVFYISAFFEANREEYYERLLGVSRDRDWTAWCSFFLTAVKVQAEENQKKSSEILRLYEQMKDQVRELTHSQYAVRALDFIFERPIFRSTEFLTNAGVPSPTAKRVLSCLRNGRVVNTLREGRGRRSAVYAFNELLRITEG